MTVTTRHLRLNGWCHRCQGHGLLSVEHVDAVIAHDGGPDMAPLWDAADVEDLWRHALRLIAKHVQELVAKRLDELDAAHGCEAGAARAFEQGRLQVVTLDMWNAVGLPVPEDVVPW